MRKYIFVFLLIIVLMVQVSAQNQRSNFGGGVKGKIVESAEKIPMEFANVVLFNSADSSQAGGTITDKNGIFEIDKIRPGNYYATFGFIGFKQKSIDDIVIKRGNTIDLGIIILEPQVYDVNDVVVTSERAPISYEIDKKVINVSEQLTALSGSAVDVLENVPSVTVDIEGNVSLRGSSNFTVLIDGRPSVLDANDALQQIPASSIENIEIITNPSAKYNPKGTAGIINVIMKKGNRAGISGVVEVNGGFNGKYGGQIIMDYKTEKIDYNFSANYNKRIFDNDRREENITTFNGVTSYLNSTGLSDWGRNSYGFRGEIGFHLSDNDIWTFGGRYGDRSHENHSNKNFIEWANIQPDKQLYQSSSEHSRGGDYFAVYSRFYHKFEKKGHELSAEIHHDQGNGDELSLNELLDSQLNITNGQKNTEKGPDKEYRVKVDYTLPFGEDSKFESGYQSEFEFSNEVTGYYKYDTDLKDYIFFEEFSHDTKYDEITHSLYSLYSNKISDFGYQIGFRGEYTYRNIKLAESSQAFSVDQWDYFPSFHFSYQLGGGNQMMASYTRRIDRPGGWRLEPFYTWMDAYNVRIGNPALLPEYIDSYELGYQTLVGKSIFSVETYYRINKNKIERVRSVFDNNVTLHTSENVGKDYAFGTELMMNFDPVQNWNMNLMGNLYKYKVEGQLFNRDFSRESFNWNIRFNNIFKLWEETQLQLSTIYNSPSVDSQGERKGFFMVNLGVRKNFFDKMLSATLQIRDLFSTGKYEFLSETPDYYNYVYGTRESPVVMLNLKFNINQQKKEEERGRGNGDEGNGFEGGEEF